MNIGHFYCQHGGVDGETAKYLGVISGCPFILQFSLLTITHQQAPLGISTQIDRTMLLLEFIQEILKLLHPIDLDKLQSLIQVVLYKKTAIRTISLLRILIRILRFHL